MKKSTQNRKDIDTLAFLYKRHHEVMRVKQSAREQIRKLRDGV